jgi:SAM-dependent methyltransferase
MTLSNTDFSEVTELSGTPITVEQLTRLHHRYTWATNYSAGKVVVETGCGVGPGLGLLAQVARTVRAGDFSPTMVGLAQRHYGDRIEVSQFDAQSLPFPDQSLDVVLLFEAIYYVPNAELFVKECRRVLRSNGYVLLVTANKDLWDFHPSPYTHKYYGVVELAEMLSRYGFKSVFFGYQDATQTSFKQRVLRPIKRLAVATGLMPKTMAGKRWLKKLVFGAEVSMPAEVTADMAVYVPPTAIPPDKPDRRHKIIYCAATITF